MDLRIIDINYHPDLLIEFEGQGEYHKYLHKNLMSVLMTYLRQRFMRIDDYINRFKKNSRLTNNNISDQEIRDLIYSEMP